jgi:hypothetical protein
MRQRRKSSCAKKAETANSYRSLSFRTESDRWKVQARTMAPLLGSFRPGLKRDLCTRMRAVTASLYPTISEGSSELALLCKLTRNM